MSSEDNNKKILRLNNKGFIKPSIRAGGFGLFTRYWDDRITDIRIRARQRVEEIINMIDKDLARLERFEKYEYLSNLNYYLNGMLTGVHTAMGYNSRPAQYPKDFDKLPQYYTSENYMQVFDHFRRQWHNANYDSRDEIKDETTGKKLPYYTYSSHPYNSIKAEKLVELANTLNTIGWTYRINAFSDHFPNNTIHIEYFKKLNGN